MGGRKFVRVRRRTPKFDAFPGWSFDQVMGKGRHWHDSNEEEQPQWKRQRLVRQVQGLHGDIYEQ